MTSPPTVEAIQMCEPDLPTQIATAVMARVNGIPLTLSGLEMRGVIQEIAAALLSKAPAQPHELTDDDLADMDESYPEPTPAMIEAAKLHATLTVKLPTATPAKGQITREELREVMLALEDLSFDCFSPVGPPQAPRMSTYNRTFDVLDRHRKRLGWESVPKEPLQRLQGGQEVATRDQLAECMATEQWLRKYPDKLVPLWSFVAPSDANEAVHFWRKALISADVLLTTFSITRKG